MTVKHIKKLLLCAMFTSLICIGTYIQIPMPVIPFTLQTLFVLLSGVLLGGKIAAASCFIYMLLGLTGLPVFTGGGGLGYVLRPSFGYIIGFIFGAYIAGRISHAVAVPTFKRLIVANLAGFAVIHLIGLTYYYIICQYYLATPIGIPTLLLHCLVMTAPGDILSCIASALIGRRLSPNIKIYF